VFGAANSADIRELLPDQTGLVVEVNSSMSRQGRGSEDCQSLNAPHVTMPDYLVVDPYFVGLEALKVRGVSESVRLPFQNTNWVPFDKSPFPPGSVSISIRPLYVSPHPSAIDLYVTDCPSPQELHRFHSGESDELPTDQYLPYSYSRSKYNSSRSFAIIHNPDHWDREIFLNAEESEKVREIRSYSFGDSSTVTDARKYREMGGYDTSAQATGGVSEAALRAQNPRLRDSNGLTPG